MEADHSERRREVRFSVEAGTTLEINNNGVVSHATTLDMSSSGVLLHFDEPVQLAPGDRVTCDFYVSHEADKPLPYWGMGRVTRVNGSDVAIDLKAIGLSRPESKG